MVRRRLAPPHVDQEDRQAVGALLGLLARRGARQQQHQVGMLGARGPDLLPVDDVVVALAHAPWCAAQRVGARGRLGDAERLQAQLAVAIAGRYSFLLRRRCRAAGACPWCTSARGRRRRCSPRRGSPPGSRRRREREAAAAVFLGDQRGEKAGLGQRRDELRRIGALAVELAPVFAGKPGAERAHRRRGCRRGLPALSCPGSAPSIRSSVRKSRDDNFDITPSARSGHCRARSHRVRARGPGSFTIAPVAPHFGADGLAWEDRRRIAAADGPRAGRDHDRRDIFRIPWHAMPKLASPCRIGPRKARPPQGDTPDRHATDWGRR